MKGAECGLEAMWRAGRLRKTSSLPLSSSDIGNKLTVLTVTPVEEHLLPPYSG